MICAIKPLLDIEIEKSLSPNDLLNVLADVSMRTLSSKTGTMILSFLRGQICTKTFLLNVKKSSAIFLPCSWNWLQSLKSIFWCWKVHRHGFSNEKKKQTLQCTEFVRQSAQPWDSLYSSSLAAWLRFYRAALAGNGLGGRGLPRGSTARAAAASPARCLCVVGRSCLALPASSLLRAKPSDIIPFRLCMRYAARGTWFASVFFSCFAPQFCQILLVLSEQNFRCLIQLWKIFLSFWNLVVVRKFWGRFWWKTSTSKSEPNTSTPWQDLCLPI